MKWYSFNTTILMLSSLLALNSESWLMVWTLMEINVVGMAIQLMEDPSKEKLIVFFIFQSLPSMAILMYLTMSWTTSNLMNNTNNNYLVVLAMLCKMGMFPLHTWILKLSKSISWFNNLIMMSWQKVVPLIMLTKIMPNKMVMTLAVVSAAVLVTYLLYSSGMKMFFMASSMVHISWMIMSTNKLGMAALMYLAMYSLMLVTLMKEMSNSKANNMENQKAKSTSIKISMLSLSGFPPLMGFLLKALIMATLIKFKTPIKMVTTMLMTTVISFYAYAQIFLKTILCEETPQKVLKDGRMSNLKVSGTWNLLAPTTILLQ